MNSKNMMILAGLEAMASSVGIDRAWGADIVMPRRSSIKPKPKPQQSEEEKQLKLAKAQAKRYRKANR